jgi:ABC-type branched-subunit amino acid transport system ATPase component
MLFIQGVGKSLGAQQALEDINFEIQQGQIRGIIGPNGSRLGALQPVAQPLRRPLYD